MFTSSQQTTPSQDLSLPLSPSAFTSFLTSASPEQCDAYIHALSADWKIGNKLWQALTQPLCWDVAAVCHEARPLDSRGDDAPPHKGKGEGKSRE